MGIVQHIIIGIRCFIYIFWFKLFVAFRLVCRIQKADTPRAGRLGRRKAGRLGTVGPAEWNADRFLRAGQKRHSSLPGHREQLSRTLFFRKHEQAKPHVNRMREQSPWLTSCLSAVYMRDEKRSLFLAADQWTVAYFVFVNPFHARHVRER